VRVPSTLTTLSHTFGELVRFHRQHRDLTRVELAALVHCSAELIRKIERDQRRPSKLVADLMATQLGLDGAEKELFLRTARIPLKSSSKGNLVGNSTSSLPQPLTSFIGRTNVVVEVSKRLSHSRLITLVGPPGVGKTRLSLEIAATMLSEFSDGVYFVPLASLSDPGLVAGAIALALSVQETGGKTITEILKAYLREKHLLLVLDNFEHLLPAAQVITELLAHALGLKVLVTSREVLQLYGEQEYPVPPMILPEYRHVDSLEMLMQTEAVMLFTQRALAVNPNFQVTPENAASIVDICIRLDGLPLAIELAAARVKFYSPQLLQELCLTG
jgi:DNA-binding XRE family transcriptional regulator